MMEAIEKCLDLVDEPTMSKLVPSLESAIRQSVGMPSKVSYTHLDSKRRHDLLPDDLCQ
jgi:proteasome component ECM29